ncbi:MAG: DUF6062 family protein [Clostridiales bacterium]|jgi:hypothetical protein|nr:DUF6062 family protein [Clostridiales bacterium]
MKESIYTIPISEAFGRLDGCPLCSLERGLEAASLEYVMGAAMMEPDVRAKTNEQGFCSAHLSKMLAMNNRLSLSLLLESHLIEIGKGLFAGAAARDGAGGGHAVNHAAVNHAGGHAARSKAAGGPTADAKKLKEASSRAARSCFVCDRIDGFMAHYYENIVYMWQAENEFRAKLAAQPFFCVRHYDALLGCAISHLGKKERPAFAGALAGLCRAYAASLLEDVSAFCRSFDYRNAGAGVSTAAASAAERAAAFLAPNI